MLDQVPPGFLVDTRWLRSHGIDSKSTNGYVARGWLERVVRGVYRRPLPAGVRQRPDAEWQMPLLSLQWILNHAVHLGGENALGLAGFIHYLTPLQEPVHLYGDVPSWLRRLPTRAQFVVHRRALFGDDVTGIIEADREPQSAHDGTVAGQVVEIWRWPIKTSSPERAILELLDELPNRESFHNVDMIFEGLTALRPNPLTALLSACRSIKVRRLFFVFADRHRHAWRDHIDTSKIDFGSGPRALVEGGKLHPKYRIYVPADLLASPDAEDDSDA